MIKILAGFVLGLLVAGGLSIAIAGAPIGEAPVKSAEPGGGPVKVSSVGKGALAKTLTTLPVTLTLLDTKTGLPIRDEKFDVPVDLNLFGDSTKSSSVFLDASTAAAVVHVKTLTTTYDSPRIEEIDRDFQVT